MKELSAIKSVAVHVYLTLWGKITTIMEEDTSHHGRSRKLTEEIHPSMKGLHSWCLHIFLVCVFRDNSLSPRRNTSMTLFYRCPSRNSAVCSKAVLM